MGRKIEKSWSVTAGGDVQGPGSADFNIICKSNANIATSRSAVDTRRTHIAAWTYYVGSRKLSCKRRSSKFYAGATDEAA